MDAGVNWKEVISDDEGERFERLAAELARHAIPQKRAVHPKMHAGLQGTLTVRNDLPDKLRVGLFATPRATHRVLIRLSNGARDIQSDTRPDLRGFALKIFGAPGRKIIDALADAETQDILLLSTPTLPFASPDEFVTFVGAAKNPLTLLPKLVLSLGFSRTQALVSGLVRATGAVKGKPLSSLTYHAIGATAFGPYAGKFRVTPRDASPSVPLARGANWLREDLAARVAKGTLTWELGVQLWTDEDATPLEDTRVVWEELRAPVVPLATIEIPTQDPTGAPGRRLEAFVDTLAFDPWHTSPEFRPLGAAMRARNAAYRVSGAQRHAAGEPKVSEVPWAS